MDEGNRDQNAQPKIEVPREEYLRMLLLLSSATKSTKKLSVHAQQAEQLKNLRDYYVNENPPDSSIDQTSQMIMDSMKLPKQVNTEYMKLFFEKQQMRAVIDRKSQENMQEAAAAWQEAKHDLNDLTDLMSKYTPKELLSQFPALHNGAGMFPANNTNAQQNNAMPGNNQTNTSSTTTTTSNTTSSFTPGGT